MGLRISKGRFGPLPLFNVHSLQRLLNISLRGVTLISRFLFVFVLAKFLEPVEVGLYGLLGATISYVMMALGFDFYTYSTREMIVTDRSKWAAMLRDQGVFYGISYVVLLPVCGFIFWYGFLPWSVAIWFFPLLVLEHIAQEFNRLLVALSEPLWASIVLFVRSGAWALGVSIWLLFFPAQRSLNFVFTVWAMSVFVACVFGAFLLRRLAPGSLVCQIDWFWIKRGLCVAFPFVLGTLSLRAFYTFDRYWMEVLGGLDVLAVYALFIGVSNAIAGFLDASVFSFSYPSIVAAAGKKNNLEVLKKIKCMYIHAFIVIIVLSFLALIICNFIVDEIGRAIYIDNFIFIYWIILANAFFSMSMVPHYGLYALRKDKLIILSHICAVPIFFISIMTLNSFFGVLAVPVGVSITFLFLFGMKVLMFHRCTPFEMDV